MKIQVLKSDGNVEPYLHTKVLGTFHNALAGINECDLAVAEQMSEAITFYLYRTAESETITSDQIHLLIQAVLSSTGFAHAAEFLNQYRLHRKLQRKRLFVVETDASLPGSEPQLYSWSKGNIVDWLIKHKKIDRLTTRVIAGAVEEKLIRMGMSRVRKSLIRELVEEETDAILHAEKQLQMIF